MCNKEWIPSDAILIVAHLRIGLRPSYRSGQSRSMATKAQPLSRLELFCLFDGIISEGRRDMTYIKIIYIKN